MSLKCLNRNIICENDKDLGKCLESLKQDFYPSIMYFLDLLQKKASSKINQYKIIFIQNCLSKSSLN